MFVILAAISITEELVRNLGNLNIKIITNTS